MRGSEERPRRTRQRRLGSERLTTRKQATEAPCGLLDGSSGAVAFMTDATCTRYVIWTASGMSAPRSGAPLAFSPDGTLLAVMHDPTPFLGEGRTFPPTGPLVKPTLDIVRTSTGESVARADNVSWAYATNVLFSPDGRRVAFLMRMPDRPSSDGLAILDVASGTVSILDAGLGAVLGWTADDRLLVASQAPGAPAPKGLQVTALDTAGIVDTIAVSSTGRIAAAQARDWTTRTRTLTLELGAERETLEMSGFPGILVWSPDGSTLLAVCHGSWSQSPDQESPDQVVLVRP